MMRSLTMALVCAAAALGPGAARADGLADLKAALQRAAASAPFRAGIEARTWRKVGEGTGATETVGQAGAVAELGARGLALVYARDAQARMDAELLARARDPEARTPVINALDELALRQVTTLVAPAPGLQRAIERALYKGERADTLQGRPVRVLSFDTPITVLSERERKYAKKYASLLEVWIGADGMPLASRLRESSSGRAFLVVSFDTQQAEDKTYAVIGERLVVTRRETTSSAAGAGERDQRRIVTTLQPLP